MRVCLVVYLSVFWSTRHVCPCICVHIFLCAVSLSVFVSLSVLGCRGLFVGFMCLHEGSVSACLSLFLGLCQSMCALVLCMSLCVGLCPVGVCVYVSEYLSPRLPVSVSVFVHDCVSVCQSVSVCWKGNCCVRGSALIYLPLPASSVSPCLRHL